MSSRTEDNIPLFQRLSAVKNEELLLSSSNEPSKRRKRTRGALLDSNLEDQAEVDVFQHKSAPAEMPSNKPVKRLRENADNSNRKFRDPRFTDLNGKLNHDKFLQAYDFLDKYQEGEYEQLSKSLKKAKSAVSRTNIKEDMGKIKQELTERRRNMKNKERLRELKHEEKEKVKDGKSPYFLKRSAKKVIALEERFKELKQSGKLQKFLLKKRKKNSNKDHRLMPSRKDEDA